MPDHASAAMTLDASRRLTAEHMLIGSSERCRTSFDRQASCRTLLDSPGVPPKLALILYCHAGMTLRRSRRSTTFGGPCRGDARRIVNAGAGMPGCVLAVRPDGQHPGERTAPLSRPGVPQLSKEAPKRCPGSFRNRGLPGVSRPSTAPHLICRTGYSVTASRPRRMFMHRGCTKNVRFCR